MKKQKMFLRMVTASLLRRRSRMAVAMLSIMIGAAILSGLLTIYIDVPRQMGAQFRSYGANMIFTGASEAGFTMEDVEAALTAFDAADLVGVAPYRYESVRINDRPVMAAGTDLSEAEKTSPFWQVDGAWPEASGEAMVGKSVASTYRLMVGDRFTITWTPEEADELTADNSRDFTVAGILDTGGSEEEYVFLSREDLSDLTVPETVLDVCELSVSATSEELSAYAENAEALAPALHASLVKRVTQSETTVLSKLQALVLLVTVIVLALTMICVATTMTATVAERRKEIGLRKALGASDQSIVEGFLGEAVFLGLLGGLFGAILGFLFAQGVSVSVFNSSISFRPALLPLTVAVSVVVTGVSCLLPIKSATSIDPAVVLKGE